MFNRPDPDPDVVYYFANAPLNVSEKCDCLLVKNFVANLVCLFEKYKKNTVINAKEGKENIDWWVIISVVENDWQTGNRRR